MLTDEMTEEQMEQAMRNAHAFELKIRAALLADILVELREMGADDAAEMVEANF
jgi:hypothetical protein